MNDIAEHYAASTGRLEAAVSYAKTVLRVALEHERMPPDRLRENMQMVVDEMRRTLAEQRVRDAATGWKCLQPSEAA